MGDMPMLFKWKVNCVMESIIFDYIGYVLISCAALCVVAPLLVYLIGLAVGAIWKIVDEGDSESPDLLKKVMPFLFSERVVKVEGGYIVTTKRRCALNASSYSHGNGRGLPCLKHCVNKNCVFKTKDEAEKAEKESASLGCSAFVNLNVIAGAFAALILIGNGLIWVPTITMYLGSSALCLLSLRWSRRGYKKVKELKIALDEHTKDMEVHK